MKKVIAIMLTLTMLSCTMGLIGSLAAETPAGSPIATVEDFINMDPSGVYYLANDLDFSATVYTKEIYQKEFKGVLDGNGHALLGIQVNRASGDAGIFANWFSGTLKNLTIGSQNAPIIISSTGAGYSVAAIAGTMRDGATFDNVHVYGNIKGDGKTAGYTAYIQSGKITVTNSSMHGSVVGDPAAGFFALSNGDSSNIVIKNSKNYASVTARGSSAGGFYTVQANVNGSRSGSLIITGCANFGSITATDWRCGGIVGEYHENKSSTLTIDYCYNMGAITMKGGGGFAAGIVGGASFDAPSGKREISNVYNAGEIKNTENASHAYAIGFANASTANATIKNAAYLDGVAAVNMALTNVKKVSASELLAAVSAFPASEEGIRFVADTDEINGGSPILSHEVVTHDNVKTYDCGRKVCLDCGAVVSKVNDETHTFTRVETQPNGYLDGYVTATCSACGYIERQPGKASAHAAEKSDGVYAIKTGENLAWYAANLKAGLLSGRESLVLQNSMDVTSAGKFSIGTKDHPFCGHFDGKGQVIASHQYSGNEASGLFGYVGSGALIEHFGLKESTVTSETSAGALIGEIMPGAIVRVRFVSVYRPAIEAKGAAGAVIGSTDLGSDVMMSAVVASEASVKGTSVGGLVGLGNALDLENCFVNATLTGEQKGTLAYHTGRFTQKNCGYVKTGATTRTDGAQVTKEAFQNGAIAYTLNRLSCRFIFGCSDNMIDFQSPIFRVMRGESAIYTDHLLDDAGAVTVYADPKTGAVVIAVNEDNGPRLMDVKITLTVNQEEKTIAFSDLTLTRRAVLNGVTYTADADTALYTLNLLGVKSFSIGDKIGNVITIG